jgi:hypothetical protein
MNKIQLCKDEILDYAIRITDLYGFGDGLNMSEWLFGYGEGGGCGGCGRFSNGSGDGSGLNHWECGDGDGFGKGWADSWGDANGKGDDYSTM